MKYFDVVFPVSDKRYLKKKNPNLLDKLMESMFVMFYKNPAIFLIITILFWGMIRMIIDESEATNELNVDYPEITDDGM
jgi:hypothetical protein